MHGFLDTTTSGNLFEKTDGSITGEETGVGFTAETDHEVAAGQYLRVDLGVGLQGLTSWQIDLASIQSGENYSIYTSSSSTAFNTGTACETGGTDSALHSLCGGTPSEFIFITGGGTQGGADIDLTEIRAVSSPVPPSGTVPEPATLLLLGSGLAGLGVLRRRLIGQS